MGDGGAVDGEAVAVQCVRCYFNCFVVGYVDDGASSTIFMVLTDAKPKVDSR